MLSAVMGEAMNLDIAELIIGNKKTNLRVLRNQQIFFFFVVLERASHCEKK